MSNYRTTLEAWLSKLEVEADRVIDVGGASNPVKDRVKKWDVGEYLIADNGLEEGTGHIGIDLNLVPDYQYYEQYGKFDIAFCLEVAEYLYKPFHSLQTIKWFLKDKGILYITFPFVYPTHNPIEADYLRYTKEGCIKLLEQGGFKIEEIIPRRMIATGYWADFCKEEGFKMRGAHKNRTVYDLGYIIKAIKC